MTAAHDPGYAGDSNVGRVRSENEDAFLIAPPLFAVADGLGGHQAGEIASSLAIDTLLEAAPRAADLKALGRAVRQANAAVIDAAATGRGRSGMGTTLTAVMVDGTRLVVAHVGDSRAYLLHLGTLEQLTDDHSLVADLVRQGRITAEESRVHPNRSVITRALGSDPDMMADTFEAQAAPGDRLLLATDGLTSMVQDTEIAHVLATSPTPDAAVDELIDRAVAAGGQDNVTVVVVDIERRGGRTSKGSGSARSVWARLLWLLAALAVVGGAAWAARSYAASKAYLIDEGGYVAVYQGVPGTFAGLTLHERSDLTTIPVSALDPITAARLGQSIQVDGLDEAAALVETYRLRAAETSSAPAP
ncbi:MAG: Stp1/IreP family PP2C-type Ser/Thr phosphatase [Coriobacteriia bacterium]|nr:Stp1/IreP family PP2C-type Ser/Thr phosphatase [Coriobacteriia bacterium]MBN2847340.1 Stp1/IreP family PP2C-type Ser/Thr phosphatase [Coriobacteriia bacterium]